MATMQGPSPVRAIAPDADGGAWMLGGTRLVHVTSDLAVSIDVAAGLADGGAAAVLAADAYGRGRLGCRRRHRASPRGRRCRDHGVAARRTRAGNRSRRSRRDLGCVGPRRHAVRPARAAGSAGSVRRRGAAACVVAGPRPHRRLPVARCGHRRDADRRAWRHGRAQSCRAAGGGGRGRGRRSERHAMDPARRRRAGRRPRRTPVHRASVAPRTAGTGLACGGAVVTVGVDRGRHRSGRPQSGDVAVAPRDCRHARDVRRGPAAGAASHGGRRCCRWAVGDPAPRQRRVRRDRLCAGLALRRIAGARRDDRRQGRVAAVQRGPCRRVGDTRGAAARIHGCEDPCRDRHGCLRRRLRSDRRGVAAGRRRTHAAEGQRAAGRVAHRTGEQRQLRRAGEHRAQRVGVGQRRDHRQGRVPPRRRAARHRYDLALCVRVGERSGGDVQADRESLRQRGRLCDVRRRVRPGEGQRRADGADHGTREQCGLHGAGDDRHCGDRGRRRRDDHQGRILPGHDEDRDRHGVPIRLRVDQRERRHLQPHREGHGRPGRGRHVGRRYGQGQQTADRNASPRRRTTRSSRRP